MRIQELEEDKEYLLIYDEKHPKIVKLLAVVRYGDCEGDCLLEFRNHKKVEYHCSYLKEIV